MKNHFAIPQLFLRLAVGIGFILPVLDRFGYLGQSGEKGIAWGDWTHFVEYTNVLIPYVNVLMATFLAIVSTALELIFGVCLILGVQIRAMAIGSFILTLAFALSMLFFSGFTAPIYASVFVVSAGSLLLATIPKYKWQLFNSSP